MSQTTRHGESVVNEIQEPSGNESEPLTLADVWNIVDNLHTHFLDTTKPDDKPRNAALKMFSRWMRELEDQDDTLPPV